MKDELRALENLHDPLAELLQARLRRAGQTDVEVRVQFTDQVTWAEFQGSRPIGCLSYSYLSSRLQVPRFSICPDNSTGDGSAFAAILTEIVTGTRHYDTLEEGAHRRFAGGLFEDIEAAWEPVMSPDMHDIKFEGDPEKPRRRVAEPSDVVAYVQFSTAAAAVAQRTCYPHKALEPLLETLEAMGRRGTA